MVVVQLIRAYVRLHEAKAHWQRHRTQGQHRMWRHSCCRLHEAKV